MKETKKILTAFLLNLFFSIFELFGGVFTNSISIISDAVHDFGDALSIGIALFLEKKSHKKADYKFTYGYSRFSVLGAFITMGLLTVSSLIVVVAAVNRIIRPVEINYNGMLIFSIVGIVVNFIATYITRSGQSLNQKAVNLHMLEDTLGWFVVLIGSIVIKVTGLTIIDPIMSILVASFILINALKGLSEVLNLFLEKTPNEISVEDLKKRIYEIVDVVDIHHLHIWSIDSINNCATMHVVIQSKKSAEVKNKIREILREFNINHITIEVEFGEECHDVECDLNHSKKIHHHH